MERDLFLTSILGSLFVLGSFGYPLYVTHFTPKFEQKIVNSQQYITDHSVYSPTNSINTTDQSLTNRFKNLHF